jgi:polysaccharide biosynthesis protein PslH
VRILFLSTWFPYPPDNGSKIRAHYLLRALAERHEITVAAFRPQGYQVGEYPDQPYDGRVQVHPVPADPFRHVTASPIARYASPLPLAFWPSRLMRETVSGLSADRRWDAVVAVQAPVAQYALQAGNGPRVIDVDTALSFQMHERYVKETGSAAKRTRNWVSWQKAHQYEARMFRRFHACTLAASIELTYVSAMVSHAQTAVKVVPNGVDCDRNHPGLARTSEATLVFNGAMTYSANFDAMHYFLAEVYPRIQQQVAGASLTITGGTSGVRLTDLQLDDSVHLSGYVDDIRPVIASATVCVVPLRQGGGTRLKILEAMALGTPVVSTSKGAEGLDVTPGHDILIADEPAEFAGQVIHLLRDAVQRERLATNARRLVEQRYDWNEIGSRFVDLVEEAVEKRAMTDRLHDESS